jgi:uncharacterized protein
MLPHKLKNMNLFNEASSYLGVIAEVTPPKIVHAMEDWRGGGMLGPVKIDHGLEGLELEFTLGGLVLQVLRQMGAVRHDAYLTRLMGAYQADDGSGIRAVEMIARGRHQELDMGDMKPGEDTEHNVKFATSYYKLIVNGREEIEIDMVAGIYRVDGIDRYAEIRAALGVF